MSSSKPGPTSSPRRIPSGLSRYLASGVRSTHEVAAYLRARGASAREAAEVVEAYRARGILDDRAAARLCAEHWARRGYGSAAIRARLAAKGLDPVLIDEALRTLGDADDEAARAHALLRRANAHAPQDRRRAARLLLARGFDQELVEQLLTESFGPIPSDAER